MNTRKTQLTRLGLSASPCVALLTRDSFSHHTPLEQLQGCGATARLVFALPSRSRRSTLDRVEGDDEYTLSSLAQEVLDATSPLQRSLFFAKFVRTFALHFSEGRVEDLLALLEHTHQELYAAPQTLESALETLREAVQGDPDHEMVLLAIKGRPSRYASLVVLDNTTVSITKDGTRLLLLPLYAAQVLAEDVGWFHASAVVAAPSSPTELALLIALAETSDVLETLPLLKASTAALCDRS